MDTAITKCTQLQHRAPGGMAELLAIALPMVVSQACQTLMMFTDRWMLAKLGPQYMSAAMGGGLTCFMFMTFLVGLTGYSTAMVAQYLGAGESRRCALAAMQGVWISLAGWPLMAICLPLGLWIFRINDLPPEQLSLQETYFSYLILGCGVELVRNALAAFFSGIGQTRVVMVSAIASLVLNVGANYLLIFGKLGFPALGIRGAAIGTILGGLCGLGVLTARYLSPGIRRHYGVAEGFRVDTGLIRKLMRFGSPSGAEFFLNMTAFNLLVLTFHSYGTVEGSAMTITLSWDLMSFVPLMGVGIAVTSLVGRYMGGGRPELAHRTTMSGVKLAAMYTTLTFTAFCLFTDAMVAIFRPAEETVLFGDISVLAVFMIRVTVIYLFADAMTIVFSSALRGAGDTFWTMVISVSGHWAVAVAAIVLIRWFDVGPRATWSMVAVLALSLACSFSLRYRSGAWRRIRVIEPGPSHEGTVTPADS